MAGHMQNVWSDHLKWASNASDLRYNANSNSTKIQQYEFCKYTILEPKLKGTSSEDKSIQLEIRINILWLCWNDE